MSPEAFLSNRKVGAGETPVRTIGEDADATDACDASALGGEVLELNGEFQNVRNSLGQGQAVHLLSFL